jgi:hypothetical protein
MYCSILGIKIKINQIFSKQEDWHKEPLALSKLSRLILNCRTTVQPYGFYKQKESRYALGGIGGRCGTLRLCNLNQRHGLSRY